MSVVSLSSSVSRVLYSGPKHLSFLGWVHIPSATSFKHAHNPNAIHPCGSKSQSVTPKADPQGQILEGVNGVSLAFASQEESFKHSNFQVDTCGCLKHFTFATRVLWQSSVKMSTAILLLTRSALCSHGKATFNCPISLVCSKCGKHISLHLTFPVLSYLSRHRESVSGECGRSGASMHMLSKKDLS